jgi:hypothetical protein
MSFRQKVLSGLYWTGSARLAAQVLSWATTLVVIRLLSPAEYGLIAMAMVFPAFSRSWERPASGRRWYRRRRSARERCAAYSRP